MVATSIALRESGFHSLCGQVSVIASVRRVIVYDGKSQLSPRRRYAREKGWRPNPITLMDYGMLLQAFSRKLMFQRARSPGRLG